jgi:hypothetical protein
MRWVVHVARMGVMRNAFIIVVKKPEVILLGRPGCEWEDNTL